MATFAIVLALWAILHDYRNRQDGIQTLATKLVTDILFIAAFALAIWEDIG